MHTSVSSQIRPTLKSGDDLVKVGSPRGQYCEYIPTPGCGMCGKMVSRKRGRSTKRCSMCIRFYRVALGYAGG